MSATMNDFSRSLWCPPIVYRFFSGETNFDKNGIDWIPFFR
jgi:hypothetical protein